DHRGTVEPVRRGTAAAGALVTADRLRRPTLAAGGRPPDAVSPGGRAPGRLGVDGTGRGGRGADPDRVGAGRDRGGDRRAVSAPVSGEAGATGASGIDAFAARAEPALGTLGALAGLGGIWNGDAVPLTRTTVIGALATAVLLVIVAAGAPALWRRRRDPLISLAAILAVLGVLGPALAATGPGLVVLEFVVDTVPGAGLLRDGQKWVALAVPGYLLAVGFGAARITGALRDRYPGRVSVPAAGATLCAVLLVLSADLAWGVGGRLAPYRYPADWAEVSAQVSGEEGDVAVVPAGSFRRFPDLD